MENTLSTTFSKKEEALKYIITYCPHIGSFCNINDVGDVFSFLEQTALDIQTSPSSGLFPSRYSEHISYAIQMVARNQFVSPPSAIASSYLATRFEYFFRLLSSHLKADGTWVSNSAKENATQALSLNLKGKRSISSVSLAYQIMQLNRDNPKVSTLCRLDGMMPKNLNESTSTSIGKRIEWCRHRVAHGEWGDISGEAIFYGLLTALIFYS